MKNKRGAIFALYLFILALLMCFMVTQIYFKQQDNVRGAVTSPLIILEMRDRLEIFEMFEEEAIDSAIKTSIDKIGNPSVAGDKFISEFRKNFFENLEEQDYVKTFLSGNLYVDGRRVDFNGEEESFKNFIEARLYSLSGTRLENGKLLVERTKLEKSFQMIPDFEKNPSWFNLFFKQEKISFPVAFSYEFSKTYEKEVK